ncbi:MAG: hypothetical protein C0606_02010 [Hyphomicrobiales bacterium]|nr:MAG: hypothetical protein C0606_02010 [Hyphomicrobiales bacterium]
MRSALLNPGMVFPIVDDVSDEAVETVHQERVAQAVSVHVTDTFDAAREAWLALEATGLFTAYQRYEWISSWHRHVGAASGVEPRIVTVEKDGRPVLVLPFGLTRGQLGTIIRFLGGTHANYNLGLFDRDFMAEIDATTLFDILKRVGAADDQIDLIHLCNQPHVWQGQRNPFSLLPNHPAANNAFATTLMPDFDALLKERRGSRGRKKLRWQKNALKDVGGYRFIRATTVAEASRILDAFCAQKAERFDAQGIHNAFANKGVDAFLTELIAHSIDSDTPAIELYGLEIDGKLRATYAGGVADGRFSGFFNSIATDEYTRVSPGELLLTEIIRTCCERGLTAFDLGIGEARYKLAWCDQRETLFETLFPISMRGRIDAGLLTAKLAAKRTVKQNPKLMGFAAATRRTLHHCSIL